LIDCDSRRALVVVFDVVLVDVTGAPSFVSGIDCRN
jgi:hypothetical protein